LAILSAEVSQRETTEILGAVRHALAE